MGTLFASGSTAVGTPACENVKSLSRFNASVHTGDAHSSQPLMSARQLHVGSVC